MRLSTFFLAVLLSLASLCGGVFYGVSSITSDDRSGNYINNSGWYTDRTFASTEASLKTRAYLAVAGLLGLPRSEAIYFLRSADSEGHSLESNIVYKISGKALPGRWWSLTLYNHDSFLIPNEEGIYSVKGVDIVTKSDGSWDVYLAPTVQGENWIPTGEGKNMSLLLRIYNPSSSVVDAMESIPMPTVEKVSTEGSGNV